MNVLTKAGILSTIQNMSDISAATTPKKMPPRRKSLTAVVKDVKDDDFSLSKKRLNTVTGAFQEVIDKILQSKQVVEKLQKEIEETKEVWEKEQKEHNVSIQEREQELEVMRKRDEEMYQYEISLRRRKAEDEFTEKKIKWEKELQDQKDEITKDKQELDALRKQVITSEAEKQKAIKEACQTLQKDLNEKFETENKLREQEIKAEKEILALKITNLTSENTRFMKEIEELKKALDQTTREVKEIALKVIESRGNPAINTSSE